MSNSLNTSTESTKPILIAGGTGNLGTQVVQQFTALGLPIRVLTRTAAHASHLQHPLVTLAIGDVRDQEAVEHAVTGVRTVISAIHGLVGMHGSNPRTVDYLGNHHLIAAAQREGIEHFVLVSIHGVTPEHRLELFRMKYQAELELKASGIPWTIIRPTAFMETWATLLGEPLLKTGHTRIFGRGSNPINFVSVSDVAQYIKLAVLDPSLRDTCFEVGGIENLNLRQVVKHFEVVTGKVANVSAIPLPVMKWMALIMRFVSPILARQIEAGIVMDTCNMTFDPTDTIRKFPNILPVRWAEFISRTYQNKN